jgi:hypothetical protein
MPGNPKLQEMQFEIRHGQRNSFTNALMYAADVTNKQNVGEIVDSKLPNFVPRNSVVKNDRLQQQK